MSTQVQKITIKRKNVSGDWDPIYPKTSIDQIVFSTGNDTGNKIVNNGKLDLSLLPDSVVGGMKFRGVLTPGNSAASNLGKYVLTNDTTSWGNMSVNIGGYVIINNERGSSLNREDLTSTGNEDTFSYTVGSGANSRTVYFRTTFLDDGTNPNNPVYVIPPEDNGPLETGDWLILTKYEGTGDQLSPYVLFFNIINNTYGDATVSSSGVVTRSGAHESGHSWNDGDRSAGVPTAAEVYNFVSGYAVAKNASLQSYGTKCKITYDSKGLVTAGEDLAGSDIPTYIDHDIRISNFSIRRKVTLNGQENSYKYIYGLFDFTALDAQDDDTMYTYTFPAASGTVALIKQIGSDSATQGIEAPYFKEGAYLLKDKYQAKHTYLTNISNETNIPQSTRGFLKKTGNTSWSIATPQAYVGAILSADPSGTANNAYLEGDIILVSVA